MIKTRLGKLYVGYLGPLLCKINELPEIYWSRMPKWKDLTVSRGITLPKTCYIILTDPALVGQRQKRKYRGFL